MTARTARVLVLLLTLGALVRAGYLVAPLMDSDQAVFGLQARHVLLGEFPVFSWGYAYIGTVQSFLDAAAFLVFGASRLVLNAVPLVFSLPFILVTFWLGHELGGERVGLVAASLVALAPPYLAIHGAWARHGYIETLLLGSLVLLLALRLARRPRPEAQEVRLFAVLGLVAGLAWWTNSLSLFYLVPAAMFLLLSDWTWPRRRGPWVALAGFLLGSAPFWLWNLLHAFWSFRLFKGGEAGEAAVQLLRVVAEGLPAIVGARASHARTNFLPVLSEGVMLLYLVAVVWLLARWLAALWTRRRVEPGVSLLLLFFAGSAVLLAVSRQTEAITAEGTKRYLLPLYSALPLLLALFLDRVRARSRAAFAVLLLVPLALHLYGNAVGYPFVKGEVAPYRAARAEDEALFRFLRARDLTRVYVTDYWLAPRLTFDAREEIVFAQPSGDRYPPYTRLVDEAPRVAYLFAAGAVDPFEASLKGIGARFEQTVVGPYAVFHDFSPPRGVEALRSLSRDGWQATASSTRTPPDRAFDRDIDTSWYSGEPQRPGQFFQVDLGRPTRVGKVSLLPPRPSIGFPRGYRVEVSSDGEHWEERAAVAATRWSLDWRAGQPRMGARERVVSAFEPTALRFVRIRQTGSDPRWWWAIGELFVYGPASGDARGGSPAAQEQVERGRADEAAGRLRDAIGAYSAAIRLAPELEAAHARLAVLYEKSGIPVEGAVAPELRARAFEALGLWGKAAREYEQEIEREAHHRDHTALWRRLVRAYREAGEAERARELEARLVREFTPPVLAAASFDGRIRFLGYRLEPGTVTPGRPFRLTYYWEARAPTRDDYAVFVHFLKDGKVAFQHDHAPLDGAYPTSRWQAGEVVRETFELVPPPELEPGAYEIVVGVWDPKTGRRLPVSDSAVPQRKDRVVVGTLTVGPRS